MVNVTLVNRAYHKYTWGYNFPIGTTPRKISISEQWVIFQGSPRFLAVSGLCRIIGISTLNFGPFSMKLGGNVWATKKMTQNDNRPCPDRNYRETAVFTFSRKLFFLAKNALYPKKTPKISYETDFYLGKGNFFLHGQNMLRIKKWVLLGPKSCFFA